MMVIVRKGIQGWGFGAKARGPMGASRRDRRWRPGQSIDNLQGWARSRPALRESGMMMMMEGNDDEMKEET